MVLELLDVSDVYAFGRWPQGLFVAVYRGRAATRHVEALHQRLEAHLAACSAAVPVLVVIEENATLGERGRKRIAFMFRALETGVSAWANVIEGQGFWTSAARTISAGVRLLSRTRFPLKVFGRVDAAASWLEAASAQPLPDGLAEGVFRLRTAISQAPDTLRAR